jgi:hypothetical protein
MSNRLLRRLVLGLATAAGLLGAGAAGAVTAPVLVVEVDSGKVIYAQGATDPWFPASITKLMTTYVALDMVRQGKVSLDSLITISPAAAAEPPSKMGFRPGTQLTLDNALKIIMVKSANDVDRRESRRLHRGLRRPHERDRRPDRHAREPLDQSQRPSGRPAMDLGARHGGARPGADPRLSRQPRPVLDQRDPVRQVDHGQP